MLCTRLRLVLPLAVLLVAGPVAAVPFGLQIYENGSLLGSYSQSTTWLACGQSGSTTSCNGGPRAVGDLTLDSWSLSLNADPVVSGTVAMTNNSGVTQQYTLLFTLPVGPIGPSSLTSGSIQGGVTDDNGDGATVAAPAGSSLYAALIDGLTMSPFQTLYPASYSASATAFDSATVPVASFGFPSPPSLPGPAVASSIGIRLDFTLTPGDSASFTSNFVVEPVPEPATGLLLGGGLAVLGIRRRKR